MKALFIACCIGLLAASAGAAEKSNSKINKATLKSLVADFYAQAAVKEFNSSLSRASVHTKNAFSINGSCEEPPQIGSCINEVCSHLPSYKCDDTAELKQIAGICANNKNGTCIEAACSKLPSYKCDDLSELSQIAKSCSGTDGQCLNTVCAKLPSYKCDDLSEIEAITKSCNGLLDGGCVDAVCSKLPSYKCDDLSELEEVIKTCKGQ